MGKIHVRATVRLRNDAMLCARARLGLSQRRCAELAGVPIAVMADMEKMKFQSLAYHHVVKVAEILDLAVEEILPEGADFIVPSTIVTQKKLHINELRALERRQNERLVLESPSAAMENKQLNEVIEKAVQALPQRHREVLMHRLNGKTFKEIGTLINRSAQTVRTVEAQALKRLRESKDISREI